MSKGGAGPYKKGADFERVVQKAYEEAGWVVTRQPKSQSPYDLIAVSREEKNQIFVDGLTISAIHLIQCKLNGKIRPLERNEIILIANEIGAVPILAWKISKTVIGWEDLRTSQKGEIRVAGSSEDEDAASEAASTEVD